MVYRYLIIESKVDMSIYEAMIMTLFSELIDVIDVHTNQNQIRIDFKTHEEISFKDVVINISQDTLEDFRLYESYQFERKEDLEKNYLLVIEKLTNIGFNEYVYINEHVMLNHFKHQIDQSLLEIIFKKYTKDHLMLETIKIFLESNQNISIASKSLFIHRNTLTQRLDKFYQSTGFDPKVFMDGYLLYNLLSD